MDITTIIRIAAGLMFVLVLVVPIVLIVVLLSRRNKAARGAAGQPTRYCPACGKYYSGQPKFCSNCGKPVV